MTAREESRNLVVCCDGTGNIWGSSYDSNVVHLVRWCEKNAQQMVYYDPGVGTADSFPDVDWIDRFIHRVKLLAGLALGRGIYENIEQAYEFLVHNYREGDKIFLFGFSRGAFTARSVAGLVNHFGIARPCAGPLLPLMVRSYFSDPKDKRAKFADDIQKHFTDAIGARAGVHFIGVWDTVDSVGGIRRRRFSTDPTLTGKRFTHVRHAVSEGEYRASYWPRLYVGEQRDEPAKVNGKDEPSLKQVWFAGAHSDVGGSYKQQGLSDIALEWMLREAGDCGLLQGTDGDPVVSNKAARAHDQALKMPLWALDGLRRRPAPALCDESLQWRLDHPSPSLSPQMSLLRHPWFVASAIAVAVMTAIVSYLTAKIAPGVASARDLAILQLQALWKHAELNARYDHGMFWPLVLDVVLIAAYTAWLSVCSVYAVRRLRTFRPSSERTHEILRYVFQVPLVAAPVADVFENAFTALLSWHDSFFFSLGVFLCAWVKTLSLAAFGLLLPFALVAGGSTSSSSRASTAHREAPAP